MICIQTGVEKGQNILSDRKIKYYFKGRSTRSQHWFDLGPNWIEGNFLTRDPEFFTRFYQKHIPGQSNKYWPEFSVLIGNAKKVKLNSIWMPLH